MAGIKKIDKITAGTVAAVIILITAFVSVIGLVVSKEPKVQAVSLGVGQVYTYDSKTAKFYAKSENEGIATVDKKGEITAVAQGECVVKLGSKKVSVTVLPAPEKVEFAVKEYILGAGEAVENPAMSADSPYIPNDLYKTSNDKVAIIDAAGKITAVAPGEAVITASTYNNLNDECKVTVKQAPEKIWFANECKELTIGKKFNLNPTVNDDAASFAIKVVSSDENILKAWDDGKIEAVAAGTATVTVTAYNGVTAEISVKTVAPPPSKYADCIRKDLDPNKPMVAFTFDDGPNASTTNRILDALEQNNGSATFFIVGNRAKSGANKETVLRMVSMGCQLGNHTYDHEHYGKSVTAADISKCTDTLKEVTGYAPSAFRPTGGELTDSIKKNAGLPIYIWSLDTLDWKTRDANQTYNKVLSNVKDGDIVLMHDIYKPTAQAVEWLAPELAKRGYQIVNIAELEYYKGVKAEKGAVYYSVK